MSRAPKVSKPTQVVLNARAKYPQVLEGAIAYLGGSELPYMKEKIDPRAADRRLLQMDPMQMAELARVDPVAAEQAAKHIYELEQKAPPLPPGMGEFDE
jgi:hypothetical protein